MTLEVGIWLPLPLIRWNRIRSKATIWPWKQEFGCFCRWPDEINFGQRQPYDPGSRKL